MCDVISKTLLLRSVEVSIRRWFPSLRTRIEERKRLFFLLFDLQTLQSQHNEGMPVDVPDPRNRIFIIKLLIYTFVKWIFELIVKKGFAVCQDKLKNE